MSTKTTMTITTVIATTMIFTMMFASPVMAVGAGGSGGSGATSGPGAASSDPTGRPSDPNFWGKVIGTQAQANDGKPGIGEHASDPVPNDDPHDTPRSGVGNQAGDGPSGHGAIVACQDANPDTPCAR
jgi:hypothetical protein